MKCPDSHCSGYSEFVRQSPSGADIHLCGECGREWGQEKPIDAEKTVGEGEEYWEGVNPWLSEAWGYGSPSVQIACFTAEDIEIMREQSERLNQLRDMIDESVYRQG